MPHASFGCDSMQWATIESNMLGGMMISRTGSGGVCPIILIQEGNNPGLRAAHRTFRVHGDLDASEFGRKTVEDEKAFPEDPALAENKLDNFERLKGAYYSRDRSNKTAGLE